MIQLRRATPADCEAIAQVHIRARQDAMPYLPRLHSDTDVTDWIGQVVLPNHVVWVAEYDGRVVGVAALDNHMLEQLYVLPGEQGKGIGSALLNQAIDHAGETLELWTFQRNIAARAFYERRGFIAVEFTNGNDNEEQEPDVRYRRRTPSSA